MSVAERVQKWSADQRRRWRSGERAWTESYVAEHPELESNLEALLDLVYSEISVREELGERPEADEYVRRFPQLAEPLQRLFEVHRALADGELGWSGQSGLGGCAGTKPEGGAATRPDRVTGGRRGPAEEQITAAACVRLVRHRARGGLGEVSVARDEQLGREVALKEIRPLYAHFPELQTRFLREAKITAGLQHPGIIPVYGLYRFSDGRPCYAMRLIEGRTLEDAVEQFHRRQGDPKRSPDQSLEFRRLLRCFIDACNAVAYAHSRGIIHRDLKPDNIMLGDFGETLVVDWGLAKPLGDHDAGDEGAAPTRPPSEDRVRLTDWGSAVGTAPFMSPEQAAGELDRLTPASDIYSLGATLYCLLTGRPPYENCDLSAIRERLRKGEICRPSDVSGHVPPALEAICMKAMAIRREARYDSAGSLAADVERWLADEPVTAWREPATARAARWARWHQTLAAATTAAVVVALLGLAAGSYLLASARFQRQLAQQEIRQTQAHAARQKQLAEQYFRQKHAFVEKYLTGYSEVGPLNVSRAVSLEKKLFEMIRDHYLEFLEQAPNYDVSPTELAAGYAWLAKVSGVLGNYAEAIDACQKAIEIRRELVEDGQAGPRFRHALARSLSDFAFLQFSRRQYEAAETSLREALDKQRELLNQEPDNAQHRCELGVYQHFLARVQLAAGDGKAALKANQAAIELLDASSADDGLANDARFVLMSCYCLHSSLLAAAGDRQRALKAAREAELLMMQLDAKMFQQMWQANQSLPPMDMFEQMSEAWSWPPMDIFEQMSEAWSWPPMDMFEQTPEAWSWPPTGSGAVWQHGAPVPLPSGAELLPEQCPSPWEALLSLFRKRTNQQHAEKGEAGTEGKGER